MFCDPTSPARQFLAAQPWFAQTPLDVQQRLQDGVEVWSVDKGSIALVAGEPARGWYAVLYGLMQLQSTAPNGKVAAFLGVPSGEWFGEGSVLKTEPRRYEVAALRDSQLLCIPRVLFGELRQTSLAFNQHLVDHLNMRLGQAMASIEAVRIRSAEQRVAMCLSGLFWKGARRIDLSQEEIGHLSGLSRQTVNRALHELERQQLVSIQFARVRIVDENNLNRFIQQPDGG